MPTTKYAPLTGLLLDHARRGEDTVELDFAVIANAVGGLPESATRLRQWWANNSHGQALAWREAGFHVDTVNLDRRRVRFARGERGGSYHDRVFVPAEPRLTAAD